MTALHFIMKCGTGLFVIARGNCVLLSTQATKPPSRVGVFTYWQLVSSVEEL